MRHPDHLGGEVTLYWSHHEKLVIVDNTRAALGGLDACFGRWDTHSHPLSDLHPTRFSQTLFPGQDLNNARVLDFQNVNDFASNALDITQVRPSFPFSPCACTIPAHLCRRSPACPGTTRA